MTDPDIATARALAAVKGWLSEDPEGIVMTIVEDPSFVEHIRIVIEFAETLDARLAAAEAVAEAAGELKVVGAVMWMAEGRKKRDRTEIDAFLSAVEAYGAAKEER